MYNNDYRKMRRKRIYIKLLIFWISLIVLVGGGYLFYRAHMVKNVTVTGNVHYTSEEIQDMVMTDELSHNSLYLSLVYKNKTIKDVPFIASMSVEVVAPDSIKIEVKEKNLAGYLKYVGQNVYFDDEGTVMEISGTYTAGIPEVSGIAVDEVVLNQKLPVEDPEIFELILEITKSLPKYKIDADKISLSTSKEITLYTGNIKVLLGSREYLDEKLNRLHNLSEALAGKSGTLDLRDDDGSKTFRPILTPDTGE